MNNRTLLWWPLLRAMDYALSPRQVSALNSRSRRKPGREGDGGLSRSLTTLAISMCLLVSLCGAQSALAKPREKVEKLTVRYLLDKDVDESDGTQIRRKLLKLLAKPNVRLFLQVVQKAEAGEPDLMVGGCRAKSLKYHPAVTLPRRCWFRIRLDGKWRFSTASGNYQITFSNWNRIAPFLGLRDFSETNQALAALELIRRGGGAADAYTPNGLALKRRIQRGFLNLLQGDTNSALCEASYDWASSTCSPFPANTKFRYVQLAAAELKKRKRGSCRNAPKQKC